MGRIAAGCLALVLLAHVVHAQERHPAMDTTWWVTLGSFLAERDFEASASAVVGRTGSGTILFDDALGLDDEPELFMGGLGWKFSENWSSTLQYFNTTRKSSTTLEESVEWQGNVYDIGVDINARTEFEITRIVFARHLRGEGPHDFRLAAGFHWLKLSAGLSGEATVGGDPNSLAFRTSTAKAEFPVPNVGFWYRFSPNRNWMLSARVDWLSATIDNYSGDIWNIAGGANYRLTDHFGIGANYQFFRISGDVKENNWRGAIQTTFTGPYLYLSGYW